eukprot:15451722-Alexandrium_andersonii.AAC.1
MPPNQGHVPRRPPRPPGRRVSADEDASRKHPRGSHAKCRGPRRAVTDTALAEPPRLLMRPTCHPM